MNLPAVRPSLRAVTLGAAVVTAGVLLAGCADTSRSAGSSTASVASTSSAPASPSDAPVDAEVFLEDLAARVDAVDSVVVTLEAPGLFASSTMDLAAGAARVLWRDEEGAVYVVVVDGQTYTSDADKIAAPWHRVSSTRVPVEQLVPSAHVAGWRAGIREVTRLGSETIEGHELTSYGLVIDTEKTFAAQGASPPPGSPATVTYILRLDETGLPRDASLDLDGDLFVFGYESWGAGLEVVAPPVG